MNAVLLSILILGGVGLVFAVLITLANKKLKVWEDPRIDIVAGMLPGANCGACGMPGCRNFAEQAVAGALKPGQCNVLDPAGAAAIAQFLGVEAGESVKKVARLLCAGDSHVSVKQAEYRGLQTCAAAATVAGGGKGCAWGCLGLGDCAVSCKFGAIRMSESGLPVVDPALCTACGDCVAACPKGLFTIMTVDQKLIVQCRSLLEGDEAEALCQVACTACGKCALDAAPGLIAMRSGLAVVDYSKNELASPNAIRRCPTGAIAWVDGQQFADKPALMESLPA